MQLLLLKTRGGYLKAHGIDGPYSFTLVREEATQFSETTYAEFLQHHPEIDHCQPLKADNSEDTRFIKMR